MSLAEFDLQITSPVSGKLLADVVYAVTSKECITSYDDTFCEFLSPGNIYYDGCPFLQIIVPKEYEKDMEMIK